MPKVPLPNFTLGDAVTQEFHKSSTVLLLKPLMRYPHSCTKFKSGPLKKSQILLCWGCPFLCVLPNLLQWDWISRDKKATSQEDYAFSLAPHLEKRKRKRKINMKRGKTKNSKAK